MAKHRTHGVHSNLEIQAIIIIKRGTYVRLTSHFLVLIDSKARKEKLEQVASFSLFGNVMSMASVQLVGASRDALLLSFKDAKVSLLIL